MARDFAIPQSMNACPAETRSAVSRLVAPAAELAVTVGTLRNLVALGDVDLSVTGLAVEVAGLLGPLAGLGHHGRSSSPTGLRRGDAPSSRERTATGAGMTLLAGHGWPDLGRASSGVVQRVRPVAGGQLGWGISE